MERNEKLERTLDERLDVIRTMKNGSEAEGNAIDSYIALYKLKIEEEKLLAEEEKAAEDRRVREEAAVEAAKQQKTENVLKGVQIGVDIAGLAASIGMFMMGLSFESEGVFCSTNVKNLISNISTIWKKRK